MKFMYVRICITTIELTKALVPRFFSLQEAHPQLYLQ